MKRFLTIALLLASLSTLAACGNSLPPKGTLATSYADIPVETHLVHIKNEQALKVVVPHMQNPNGSIFGALMAGVSNSVSAVKRQNGISEIDAAISGSEVNALIGDTYGPIIKSANWMEISKTNTIKAKNYLDKDALDSIRETTDQPTVTTYSSNIVIGDSYQNLAQHLHIEIRTAQDNKLIYWLTESDVFTPDTIEDIEDLTNYRYWTANNAALIKKGIETTTANIKRKLEQDIKDPRAVK